MAKRFAIPKLCLDLEEVHVSSEQEIPAEERRSGRRVEQPQERLVGPGGDGIDRDNIRKLRENVPVLGREPTEHDQHMLGSQRSVAMGSLPLHLLPSIQPSHDYKSDHDSR